MTEAEGTESLSLLEALRTWCDDDLVQKIVAEEARLTPNELITFHLPKLSPETSWRQPSRDEWMGSSNTSFLHAAWDSLFADFRRRIERREVHLAGFASNDDPATMIEALPSFWASEFIFDLVGNAITRRDRRYVAVEVSLRPRVTTTKPQPASDAAPKTLPVISEIVGTLSDDDLFLLLDEYARRVTVEEGSSLKLPVKVSFIPILRRKLSHRFEIGENAATLDAEGDALETWIKSKVDGHQTPTAAHIKNELRDDHRRLKAQYPRAGSKDRQS